MTFNPGDRVRRIGGNEYSGIRIGEVYTVTRLTGDDLRVEGLYGTFSPRYFELVTPASDTTLPERFPIGTHVRVTQAHASLSVGEEFYITGYRPPTHTVAGDRVDLQAASSPSSTVSSWVLSSNHIEIVADAPALPPVGSRIRITRNHGQHFVGEEYVVVSHDTNGTLTGEFRVSSASTGSRPVSTDGTHNYSNIDPTRIEIIQAATPQDAPTKTPEQELADFKTLLRDVTKREAAAHSWCGRTDEWLEELGLPRRSADIPDDLKKIGTVVTVTDRDGNVTHARVSSRGDFQWHYDTTRPARFSRRGYREMTSGLELKVVVPGDGADVEICY